MATRTRKHTARTVLELARKIHGRRANVTENRHALDAAGKAKLREQLVGMKAERDRIKAALPKGGSLAVLRELVPAARFAVDVDGDDPSLPQLESVTAAAETFLDNFDRLAELDKAIRTATSNYNADRCYVGVADSMFNVIVAHGDTWNDVAAKLEADAAAKKGGK
jgi:hypothetical protein